MLASQVTGKLGDGEGGGVVGDEEYRGSGFKMGLESRVINVEERRGGRTFLNVFCNVMILFSR